MTKPAGKVAYEALMEVLAQHGLIIVAHNDGQIDLIDAGMMHYITGYVTASYRYALQEQEKAK